MYCPSRGLHLSVRPDRRRLDTSPDIRTSCTTSSPGEGCRVRSAPRLSFVSSSLPHQPTPLTSLILQDVGFLSSFWYMVVSTIPSLVLPGDRKKVSVYTESRKSSSPLYTKVSRRPLKTNTTSFTTLGKIM